MSDLIREAVKGAAVGWTLGASHRGKKVFTRLSFFDPVPLRMAQSDALDAWHVWAAHLKAGKPPETLADSWLACWRGRSEEGGFGLMNLRRGLRPGISGSYANPLGEGSEGLGRAAFWGLAFHGDPEKAASWAVADSSIDHFGDGVTVSALVAWWIASAGPSTTLTDLISVANALLPVESLATRSVQAVLSKSGDVDAAKNLLLTLPVQLGLADSAHAALTLAWILCGLQSGLSVWGSAPLIAAGCGSASDHAALVAGVLATLVTGSVPSDWANVIGDDYVSGHGLVGVEPSRSLSALSSLVASRESDRAPAHATSASKPDALTLAKIRWSTESPAEVPESNDEPAIGGAAVGQGDPGQAIAVTHISEVPVPSPDLSSAMANAGKSHSIMHGDLLVQAVYHSPPAVKPGGSLQLQVVITNLGTTDVAVEPGLSLPQGWQAAHRLVPFMALAGRPTSFALVAQAPGDWADKAASLTLHLGDTDFNIPVLAAERWNVIGPFANAEGLGYEKAYAPETEQSASQALSSRSNLPLKWKTEMLPGTVFEVEPYFEGGPGVVYLFANARLPKPGQYRVFAACDAGVMVFVDGKKCVSYFDRTKPVPRFGPPYIGECIASELTKVLVKVVRGREPVGPLYLSFYNEDGEVVSLSGFEVMG